MRRAEVLQWFGLVGAPAAWTVQLVVGFYVALGTCSPAAPALGIDRDAWMIALTVAAGVIALLAEAAAAALLLETRRVDESGAPPAGRHRFFASAAVVGNALFLNMIVLTGISVLHHSCRPA